MPPPGGPSGPPGHSRLDTPAPTRYNKGVLKLPPGAHGSAPFPRDGKGAHPGPFLFALDRAHNRIVQYLHMMLLSIRNAFPWERKTGPSPGLSFCPHHRYNAADRGDKNTTPSRPQSPPGVFSYANATKPMLFCCVQFGQIKNAPCAYCIPS